jgi:hypothetical protein
MDIRATLPPALAASPATAGGDQAQALHGLASVVLDTTGSVTDGDKLSAYNSSYKQAVTGRFSNLGPEDRRVLNQVGNSATAQAVGGARATYETKMMGAIRQAGASGAPHGQALGAAALNHFDSLSGHDQNLLFSSLNAPDRAGATPFASVSDWRGQMAGMGRPSAPVDRVELSDAAKALVGAAGPAAPAAPTPYVSGSVASIRA